MATRAIVVVEDNDAIARMIQEVLNDVPGYGAVTVADGALALSVLQAIHTDLVILDVQLPGLTGFELYDRLQSRSETARIPCLFMSAVNQTDELRCRGIQDFLTKPFDLDDLLERVERLCAAPRPSRPRRPHAS